MQPGIATGGAALDSWLQQELTRAYDATLREPIPDELLRLLGASCEAE